MTHTQPFPQCQIQDLHTGAGPAEHPDHPVADALVTIAPSLLSAVVGKEHMPVGPGCTLIKAVHRKDPLVSRQGKAILQQDIHGQLIPVDADDPARGVGGIVRCQAEALQTQIFAVLNLKAGLEGIRICLIKVRDQSGTVSRNGHIPKVLQPNSVFQIIVTGGQQQLCVFLCRSEKRLQLCRAFHTGGGQDAILGPIIQ